MDALQLNTALSLLQDFHGNLDDHVANTTLPRAKFRYLGETEWLGRGFFLDVDRTIEVVAPLPVGDCVIARVEGSVLASKILANLGKVDLTDAPNVRGPFEELGLDVSAVKATQFRGKRNGILDLQPPFRCQYVALGLSLHACVSLEGEKPHIFVAYLCTSRRLLEWLVPPSDSRCIVNALGPKKSDLRNESGTDVPLRVQHSANIGEGSKHVFFADYHDLSSWDKTKGSLELMIANIKAIDKVYQQRRSVYLVAEKRLIDLHREITGEIILSSSSVWNNVKEGRDDTDERPRKRSRH